MQCWAREQGQSPHGWQKTIEEKNKLIVCLIGYSSNMLSSYMIPVYIQVVCLFL